MSGLPQAAGPQPRQSKRLNSPHPQADKVPQEEGGSLPGDAQEPEIEDKALLEIASKTGKLHLVVFKGAAATKCDLLIGAPGGARYIIHGKPGAISGTEALRDYGPAAKSQNSSFFVLSEAEIEAEAKDLKRDTSRKSLGDWMELYSKEMEALQPSLEKQPVGDKPPKKASLSGIPSQAAKTKKSKQAPSKVNKGAAEAKSSGGARNTRNATRELVGGGGKEEHAKVAGMGKEGKKGKQAAVKEGEKARVKETAGAEALVELKTGKPARAKGKRSGVAQGGKRKAGEVMSPGVKRGKKARVEADGGTSARKEAKPGKKATKEEVQQPAVIGGLPNLTSKQFLGLSKESQKTYTMSHALLAGLAMIAKSEQPT